MDRLLNVTTAISLIMLILVLFSVRRAHIRPEYSITWLLGSVAIFILSRCRGVLEHLRVLTGLPDTPLTIFLLASGILLIMIFRFSVIISHLRDDNIALAQRVAILEYHIESLNKHQG